MKILKLQYSLSDEHSFLILSEEPRVADNASSLAVGKTVTNTLSSHAASHPATPSSATTDPWPAQSDEDIDRLVAMHQNRHNSLGSLGVS